MAVTYRTLLSSGVRTLTTGPDVGSDDSLSPSPGQAPSVQYSSNADDPGFVGATPTGSWSIEVNVTTGDSNCSIFASLLRLNSSAVIQARQDTSPFTATVGLKTYSFSNPNLGTWGATDRFGVEISVSNDAAHGGSRTVAWTTGDDNSEVVAQFSAVFAPLDPMGMSGFFGG